MPVLPLITPLMFIVLSNDQKKKLVSKRKKNINKNELLES